MKKTVIFYKDWYEAIKEFTDEERLAAYDAIMQYAFEDKEPNNKFIKAATALMRSAIERDNTKYEEKCRKRSEAGKRGNAVRWGKQSQSVANVANAINVSQKSQKSQMVANVAYNDNVNDNVNDNEPTNVGEKKIEKTTNVVKKTKKAPTDSGAGEKRFKRPTVDEVAAYCSERGNYVDAQHFVDYYESKGWKVGNAPMKDWEAAVRTWEQRDGRARRPVPKGTTLGVGEWVDERGERRYGTGQHTVPMSAPPRPSEGSYWSIDSKQWISGV